MREIKWPVVKPSGRMTVEMAADERWKLTCNAWRNSFFLYSREIAARIGWEEVTKLAANMWAKLASPEIAAHYVKRYDVKERGAAQISKVLQYQFYQEGFDLDVVEESEGRAVIRLLICPWWQDLTKRWLEVTTEFWIQSSCGPACHDWVAALCQYSEFKLKMTRPRWVAQGDAYCEYAIELEQITRD